MPKFIKADAPEGRLVLNGHYVFENGILTCTKSDAAKMKKILVTYYGCKLVDDDVEGEVDSTVIADSSLNVDVTKTGLKESEAPVEAKVKAKA